MEKRKRRWNQLSLRILLIVTSLAPPLLAGGYFLLCIVEAPPLAVFGSIAMIVFWIAIGARVIGGWFWRSSRENSADPPVV
jgi:hypothetical protein